MARLCRSDEGVKPASRDMGAGRQIFSNAKRPKIYLGVELPAGFDLMYCRLPREPCDILCPYVFLYNCTEGIYVQSFFGV